MGNIHQESCEIFKYTAKSVVHNATLNLSDALLQKLGCQACSGFTIEQPT